MPKDTDHEEGGTTDQLTVPRTNDYDHGASPTASHGTVAWSIIDGVSSQGGTHPGDAGLPAFPEQQWSPPPEAPVFDPQHDHDEIEIALQSVERQRRQLTALHEVGSSFVRRYAKLAMVREEALSLRSRIVFEWDNCINHRRFVTDSQDNFIKEASAFLASIPPELSSDRLLALHNQVLQDYERQNELAQTTRDMGISLSDLEFSIQGKERRVAMAAARLSEILSQLNLPGQSGSVTAVETEPSSSPSEAESVDVHPLIQHYYDKAGDVNLEKEHLVNLELEHKEAREARIFLEEQERPLSRSNEEFEEMYLKAYAQGEYALAEATRKAELAKAVCLSENLDPEAYRKAPSQHENERTATPAPSDGIDMQGTPSSRAVGVYEDVQTYRTVPVLNLSEEAQDGQTQLSAPASPTNRRRKRTKPRPSQRIRDWIETVYDEADGTSRSRSVSESRDPIPIFEKRDDGTLAFNRKSPEAQDHRYQKRGSLASYSTAFAKKSHEEIPTIPLKKSSSESELIIFPSRTTSREDVLQGLRTYATDSRRA